MADILSQAEIDALLAALTSGEINPNELKEEEKTKRVRPYDFRRPNKFSKEQINSIHVIYENYSRTLATFLSAQLRTIVQISVLSLEQLTYDEFIRSLPDPSIIVIYNMDPLDGNGIFEIQPPIAFGMIDRLLGGSGSAIHKIRPLTEIERTIIERLSQRMLNLMGEAWENIVKLNPKVEFIESNPQFAQIVSPMEMVLLVSLDVKIGEIEGMITFCLPYIVLEPVINKLSLHLWFARTANEQNPAYRMSIQKRIESAKVPLHVLLGTTTITVRELLELQVGDVVPLERKVSEDLDVLIGSSPKFRGKPGILNRKLAIQITGFQQEKGGDLA